MYMMIGGKQPFTWGTAFHFFEKQVGDFPSTQRERRLFGSFSASENVAAPATTATAIVVDTNVSIIVDG